MDHPADINLPFFAYGLFKPGQLGFFQLRGLVSGDAREACIQGDLRLRDGLPIIDPEGTETVRGTLLEFSRASASAAYDGISAMEPDKHYRWLTMRADGVKANVLVGRSPRSGSIHSEEEEWDGWSDPLFTAALDVVEETLQSQQFDWDLKPLFRLQMAYLLLWSSIERYVSLRYHLGDKVTQKLNQLARESAFIAGIRQRVEEPRHVFRADCPNQREVLDPTSPETSVAYYYQVRSNITHRGKGVVRDYEHVSMSLSELLPTFREVLAAAREDAGYMT